MSKYDELAQAIVDYEEIGHYDLIDAYDTIENAFAQIKTDLEGDIRDVTKAKVHYESTLFYEEPDDDEAILLNRIIDLCKEIEREYDNKAWDKFVTMTNTYRALGYRIVAFEREVEGGWIMAFDTHGKNATELPKEAFNIPEVMEWCKFLGWNSVTDDDVMVFDETDDLDDIHGSYDYCANFPVMQLATV